MQTNSDQTASAIMIIPKLSLIDHVKVTNMYTLQGENIHYT